MSSKGTILVVEDTPVNLKLLVDTLRADGYEVFPANSGEKALVEVAAPIVPAPLATLHTSSGGFALTVTW